MFNSMQSQQRSLIDSLDESDLISEKNNSDFFKNRIFSKSFHSKEQDLSQKNIVNESIIIPKLNFQNQHAIYTDIMIPELHASYCTEILIKQINQEHIKIQQWSGGRIEVYFNDIHETYLNEIRLTRWSNGDYKLYYQDQIYYWHNKDNYLDKYSILT